MAKKNKVKYEKFNEVGFKTNQLLFEEKGKACDDTLVVVVTHSFYSSLPYIEACEHIAGKNNMHIVMKTSSSSDDFRSDIENMGYSVSDLTKKDFKKRPDKVIQEIKSLLSEKGLKKVLIMDHGGYASYHMQELCKELPVSGIVEYTINGQNKFDEVFKLSPALREKVSYVSIGKSPLKYHADVSCGQLIGQLTQQAVQEKTGFGVHLRDFTKVGIVGFGTLGEAAANQLSHNGAQNIIVYDVDEGRRTKAALSGYEVVDNSPEGLKSLVQKCNVVIVGTDKKPIDKETFRHLQDGAIITGVTSADDTWDLPERINDGTVTSARQKLLKGKFRELRFGDGKKIFALYDGEAPNLAGSEIGVMDPSINLPTSLHAVLAWHIAKHGEIPDGKKVADYEKEVNKHYNDAYAAAQREMQTSNGRGHQHANLA